MKHCLTFHRIKLPKENYETSQVIIARHQLTILTTDDLEKESIINPTPTRHTASQSTVNITGVHCKHTFTKYFKPIYN